MRNLTTTLLTFILVMTFVSCHKTKGREDKDNYLRSPQISNEQGLPKSPLTFYFPENIRKDSGIVKTGIDTFMLNWFSSALYAAHEPILYNYYSGHDIYRFLWLRSFHRPFVFSLHRNGNKVWLTTKGLDKQPQFIDEYNPIIFVAPKLLTNGEYDTTQVQTRGKESEHIIKKADRKATVLFVQTTILTVKDWEEFDNLLNDCLFWTSKPFIQTVGLDGAQWTIEAHLKNKYWYVNRWSPDGAFRKAGEYLIKKSGFKEEIY